ncbi:ClpP/crotonase [Xylaria telfairii]|nr:ClpP/crotonase [Xylaria telfairii]
MDKLQDFLSAAGGNATHGGAYPAGGPRADDDDWKEAAQHASKHAGDSGDTDLFSNLLGALGQKKQRLADEDIDEDEAVRTHKKYFQDEDDDKDADDRSMGSAAAMQALKMFTGGESGNTSKTSSQGAFVALAMAEASKLFDKKASQGKVSSDSSKESAVMQAGEMALKMYMKSQGSIHTFVINNMAQQQHPESYATYTALPEISFQHVPATAPTATRVIILRLDRPKANNAFTETMMRSLVSAFDLLSTDARVKAIVFTGADSRNRVFCPGMDLDAASASASGGHGSLSLGSGNGAKEGGNAAADIAAARAEYRDGGAQVSLAIYRCAKPVIAALNGHAVGVGITMTLPANVRIVSEAAKVGFVFSRRAINTEACSSYFLPRILGAGRALTLLTTGSVYGASDPTVRDLFAEIVPPERVIPRAVELAQDIADNTSGVAVRVMKDMLYKGAPATPEEAFLLESRVFFDLFRGRDSVEGVRSFLEKRKPRFDAVWEQDRPTTWPWWEENEKDKNALKPKI